MAYRRKHRQAGIFLILFSFTLPVLLGLLVLAIDCGALYLARLRLTKVARVASGTGLNVMALRGWGPLVADQAPQPTGSGLNLGLRTANVAISPPQETQANQALLTEIHQSALDALKTYFPRDFESLNSGVGPSYLWYKDRSGNSSRTPSLNSLDLQDSSVSITIRYAVKTYLLNSLSQIIGTSGMCSDGGDESARRCWIESSPTPDNKTGRMRSANVMMLLDVSGSMNEQVNGKPKKDALVEAAASFIDMFNPRHDKFAIIPYATTADVGSVPVLAPLVASTSASGADYLPVKIAIQNYTVGGQTNQCDALVQVIRTIDANPTLQDRNTPKFVLLFTDGAPNVYRLSFCEGTNCSQTPTLLQTALNSGPFGAEAASPGWYGWTVKWDKREVFRRVPPHDTCPADGSGGGETAPTPPGTGIPECDPVWAFPKVIAGNPGPELTYTEVSNHLRLHETKGEFYFRGGSRNGRTLNDLGYSLKFRDWGSPQAAYQSSDAFRWHGPSYLVHSSFRIPRGISLVDRIPEELIGTSTPVTCGPGSRAPFPGSITSSAPQVADKYNHSRYFASRVIDANWRWDENASDDSANKATKTGLTTDQLQNAPPYFDPSHTIDTTPNSPGCLNTLQSKVPFTNAQIHVGDNFVSNNGSTLTRGESVKTAELPYYCALRAADWLRSQYNVVIFVVGLGPSANSIYNQPNRTCEDPLQNALDPNSRKDRFLRRLAFAPESLSDPTAILDSDANTTPVWSSDSNFGLRTASLSSCQNHPLAGETVEVGYSETPIAQSINTTPSGYPPSKHEFTSEHLGAYFAADDPEKLKILFGEIAKRVLLRLAT
jgi:hypothetical protein